MAKIPSMAACMAVVAALLPIGIGVSIPIDSAHAEDKCATAPGAAAPKGQHWYYRVDSVNHRKCWYLHAAVALPVRAAAERPATRATAESAAAHSVPAPPVATPQWPSAATAQATDAASAPQAPANISNVPSEAAGTPPAPHVTLLNVKPANAPLVATPSASEAVPEQAGEPPMPQTVPQTSPSTANMSADADPKPARGDNLATVQAAPDTSQDSPPAQTDAAAPAPRQSASLLFPLLALALGIAAGLIALLSKMTALARTPRLSQDPEDAWRRYSTADQPADEAIMHEEQAPFLAPHEPHAAVDLDVAAWPEQPSLAPANSPVTRRQYRKPRQREEVGLTQQDIERALRIIRQPVRGVVPSGKES
jgi:hypothetical protein